MCDLLCSTSLSVWVLFHADACTWGHRTRKLLCGAVGCTDLKHRILELPRHPVIKTPSFQCWRRGFDPLWGNYIPMCRQKKKKRIKQSLLKKLHIELPRQWQPTPVLLPGKSHGRKSLVGCSPWGHTESDTTEQLHFHFSLSCIGEGNGNPLQCSCLENPRDGGAWWAAVSGVAQSWTRLKRFSSSSSNSTSRYIPKRTENAFTQNLGMNFCSSIIHKSQNVEIGQVSIN